MIEKRNNKSYLYQLKEQYRIKKKEILSRLQEFEKLWSERNDEEIFSELAFCILTPQSKARLCWDAIVQLKENNLLFNGTVKQLKPYVHCARFKNKKAHYVIEARELFTHDGKISIKSFLSTFDDIHECREWLVRNIRGLGYKEASHFLRNIGFGEKIAILDRHILRNLNQLGIIREMPHSLSKKKYRDIEKHMMTYSKKIDIPISHLDLLLWYKETGEIFK